MEEEINQRTHRQHPIPQHIGAFKFKLVGQFTLKEFGYLAVFGAFAWIVLASRLIFLIKFPLATLLFSLGAALALVPVAGRPLDSMFLAFLKAILSPTQRIWIKKGNLPEFFQPEFGKPKAETATPQTRTSRRVLEEYLSQFNPKPTQADLAEAAYLSKLNWNLTLPPKLAMAIPPADLAEVMTPAKPTEEKLETEELAGKAKEEPNELAPQEPIKEQPVPPVAAPELAVAPVKKSPAKPAEEEEAIAGITAEERKLPQEETVIPIASSVNYVERPVFTLPSPVARPIILPTIGQIKVRKLKTRPDLSGGFSLKVRGEKKFEITPQLKARLGLTTTLPKSQPRAEKEVGVKPVKNGRLEKTTTSENLSIEEEQPEAKEPKSKPRPKKAKKTSQTSKVSQTKPSGNGKTPPTEESVQTKTVPPPPIKTPSQANLITGMVKDTNGRLLENVIIIVKNENGSPVRAMKTNLLGQFSISTPLPSGKYTIHCEKEGYKFSIIEFEAKGEIIQPIEIVGRS